MGRLALPARSWVSAWRGHKAMLVRGVRCALAGSAVVSSSVEGHASASVAMSGTLCIDEDRDDACGPFDSLASMTLVELLGPDGDTLAFTLSGDRYEFAGLPTRVQALPLACCSLIP